MGVTGGSHGVCISGQGANDRKGRHRGLPGDETSAKLKDIFFFFPPFFSLLKSYLPS